MNLASDLLKYFPPHTELRTCCFCRQLFGRSYLIWPRNPHRRGVRQVAKLSPLILNAWPLHSHFLPAQTIHWKAQKHAMFTSVMKLHLVHESLALYYRLRKSSESHVQTVLSLTRLCVITMASNLCYTSTEVVLVIVFSFILSLLL